MWRKRGSCPAGGGGCVKYRRPKELNADLIWSEAVSEEDEIFITVVMLVCLYCEETRLKNKNTEICRNPADFIHDKAEKKFSNHLFFMLTSNTHQLLNTE